MVIVLTCRTHFLGLFCYRFEFRLKGIIHQLRVGEGGGSTPTTKIVLAKYQLILVIKL